MEINISEEVEMKKIQQAILQISGSASRLGVDIDSLKIQMSFEDYEYIRRLIRDNPNWSCNKYCKIVNDEVLSINGVRIRVK